MLKYMVKQIFDLTDYLQNGWNFRTPKKSYYDATIKKTTQTTTVINRVIQITVGK